MTETPDRIESVFAAAVALAAEERATYLDQACADDPALREHVEALLRAHDRAGHLLDRPVSGNPVPGNLDQTTACVPSEQPGTVIAGRYKLLEEIGEGGMGTVWVAEQTQPVRRKVALKLIKPGMDSRSVLARFEAERQALAVMDHPNIAKVLDGGLTETGRPFFVMEYVKGVPITEYCDATRLNVPERLQLFVQVCQAVQHAHHKGIIHRDLKPSNILVAPYDDRPVPKVIDFGLAKAMHQSLTERTLHTAHETVLGTPLYMSPEQAQLNNLDVDTRSDLYSLGVLLYELLTGTTPLEKQRFKAAAWDEVRRIIREEEPPRPSTRLSSSRMLPSLAAGRQTEPARLTKLVRGDLDWIVMKALEKNRTRRYETANGFALDVERYLAGEPVLAAPPSARYRLRKFARKHRTALTTAAAMIVLLLAGAAFSTWQAMRAFRAEAVALAAKQEALQAQVIAEERQAEAERQKGLARGEKERADDNLRRAQSAEATAQHDLAGALLAQARLASKSRLPGQRFETLEALAKVRQIEGASRKLADEAVAALCLPDLVVVQQWRGAPQGTDKVAFCPLLDIYARSDVDGNISVRRVDNDTQIAAFRTGHRLGDYNGLEFSPDGKYLRATTYNESAGSRLFRVDVTPAKTVLDDNHIALAFSPDSRRFVARYPGNEYRLCELPSGKELKRFVFPGEAGNTTCIYWNPCKPQIAIVHAGGWRIADLETGEQQAECPVPANAGIVAWHPDGRHLAVGTDHPPAVEIYDTVTRRIVGPRFVGIETQGVVPAFNHAGNLLVTNDWSNVRRLWDPASGTQLLHVGAQDRNFFLVSPDDRRAAFNVEGQDLQLLRIARGARREFAVALPENKMEMREYGAHIAPSPDGRILALDSSRGVSLLDAHSGLELAIVPDQEPVRFDAAGALLTYGADGFRRWPMQWNSTKQILRVKNPQRLFNGNHETAEYSLSSDGAVVAVAGPLSDGPGATVMRQTRYEGEVRTVDTGVQHDVRQCAVSPDGKWVATSSHFGASPPLTNVRVWDAATGNLVKMLPVGELVTAWFSPKGRWLATLSVIDGECRLWRSGSWEAGPRFSGAKDIAFSPHERIAALGGKPGQIQLCETESGREFGILPIADGGAARPRCFSPDGTRLYATVGREGKIYAWDLLQIRDGLRELGLDQGWPEFPTRLDDNSPPIVELELGTTVGVLKDRVRGMALPKPVEPLEATVADVAAYLTRRVEGLQPEDMELALLAVQTLETVDRGNLAADMAASAAKLAAGVQDKEVVQGRELLEGAVRRLGLAGKAIRLEGTALDGAKFDWPAYRGKVVLLAFWDLASDRCKLELHHAELLRRLYHDRGFEVVGVSMDADRAALSDSLRKEPVPWATLRDDGTEGSHPIATYYGVLETPTMLVVDKQGKVASPHARGGDLDRLLDRLLGPACVPTGRLTSIDLQSKAKIGLGGVFDTTKRPNNLAELPHGEQVLAGVKFTIGKGLIQLDNRHLAENLRTVAAEAIPVDRSFTRLYVLHGTQWGSAGDGEPIGQYRLHYQDGTTASFPIVLGEDVRDWWNEDHSKAVTRGIVAWVGQNSASRLKKTWLRLYLAAWDNPHPEKKVVSLDFLRDGVSNAGPFCVAMTVEEPAAGQAR